MLFYVAIGLFICTTTWAVLSDRALNDSTKKCRKNAFDCWKLGIERFNANDSGAAFFYLGRACGTALIDETNYATTWHELLATGGLVAEAMNQTGLAASLYEEARRMLGTAKFYPTENHPNSMGQYTIRESSCYGKRSEWELMFDRATGALNAYERHGKLGVGGDTVRNLVLNRFVASLRLTASEDVRIKRTRSSDYRYLRKNCSDKKFEEFATKCKCKEYRTSDRMVSDWADLDRTAFDGVKNWLINTPA